MGLKDIDMKHIFLLCSERSGSNLITKLMNNHSQICGPSTKHIINPTARNYFRYQPFNEENWRVLTNDILNLFNVSFSHWKSQFSNDEILDNIPIGDLPALVKYFFEKETKENGKKHCFIKEIKVHEFYPFLKYYFSDAIYLYQVRDPRDMALSWKKNKSHKGGIVEAAKQWKQDQQQYLKIKALEEENKNIIFQKYEDLVSNTNAVLSSALGHLGLAFEENMIDLEKDKLTIKNSSQQEAWVNLSKPVMKSNYNKFVEELTEREIQIIESICYFEMQYLEYKPMNKWEELTSIYQKEIETYHHIENEKLEYTPNDGVKNNMQAKKRFYQKI